MDRLLEVQCAVSSALCGGPLPAAAAFAGTDAGELLQLHRNTVRGALVKALRLTYPAVLRLTGEPFFEGAAALYADAHPPVDADLNRYGESFPPFLAQLPACAGLPYLADVARVDAAVARALHADDAEPVAPGELSAHMERADAMSFVAHPSVTLLRSCFPAGAIWHAVMNGEAAALAQLDSGGGPEYLLVERGPDGPRVVSLEPAPWRFAVALFSGEPLEEAVTSAGAQAGEWLAGHLAARRITGVRFHHEENK